MTATSPPHLNSSTALPQARVSDAGCAAADNATPTETAALRFPQSWYPLCRARDLRPGRVMALHAFGVRLVLYRDADRHPRALYGYCAHLGSDLSRGRVVQGQLQCPLHHWRYDGHGYCRHIPVDEAIPAGARLPALVCVERYGLVFGFLGSTPDFALPVFHDIDKPLHGRATVVDVATSLVMFGANGFDQQHYARVHGRALFGPIRLTTLASQHLRGELSARITGNGLMRALGRPLLNLRMDCWGGNHFLMTLGPRVGNRMISVLPLDAQRSRVFILEIERAATGWRRGWQRVRIAINQWLFLMFVRQDLRVFHAMRFQPGALLPIADSSLRAWLVYWRDLKCVALHDSQPDALAPPPGRGKNASA